MGLVLIFVLICLRDEENKVVLKYNIAERALFEYKMEPFFKSFVNSIYSKIMLKCPFTGFDLNFTLYKNSSL